MITDMYASPQPAHNQDPVASSGMAWIVSSSNNDTADVVYRTVVWSGGTPTLSNTFHSDNTGLRYAARRAGKRQLDQHRRG